MLGLILYPGLWLAAQDVAQVRPALQAVPHPDLSSLEPAVREQLADARQILDDVLADDEVEAHTLAESYGSMAKLYHAYQLLSAARVCYLDALTLAGNDLRWNYLLAHLLQSEGQFDWASFFFQRALAIDPTDVPSAFHLAEVRQQQGREQEAIQLYRRALALDSSCAAAHFGLGQVALAQKRYGEAVEHFERTLKQVPAASQVHYPLALAYRGLGQTEEARRHLEQRGEVGVRVADPLIDSLNELKTGEIVFVLMGRRAFKAGDYTSAKDFFEKAVEAEPHSFRALTNLGTVLAALGDEAGAIERFQAAAEAGSESTSLYYNLAVLLNRRGDYEQAVKRLDFILDREPGDQAARLELARALEVLGRKDAALEQLRTVVQSSPEDTEARFREASLLTNLGRFREAIERLTEANRLFSEDGKLAHGLARLLAACPDRSLRDGARALELALAVFQARPEPFFGETVSLAYAELGQCAKALEWQQGLIESARKAGSQDWVRRLEKEAVRFQGQPCRP